MIQSFREKLSGVIAIALIILIAIPLAFFGVDSLFLSSTRISEVAEVNGQGISELELERAVVSRQSQIAQMLGENYSSDSVSESQLREAALNDLIVQKLYLSETINLNLGVSDRLVADQILSMESFQLAGEFSDILFRNYIGQMGYTTATFMESLSDEFSVRQLTNSILSSAIGTDFTVERLVGVAYETRSYQYVEIPVESALDDVGVSLEEISAYYESNQEQFQQPERVSVNYLNLSRDQFVEDVVIDSEEVMQRFELLQATQPTQREVAHILIETTDDGAESATLDEIQQRLEGGESFETLAEEFSVDIGSSANGGYLGFSSGDTFPFEFEQALLDLDVGDVSMPVQTEAGFHIIKLLAVQAELLQVEEEYAGLELQVKQEKAEELYVEALQAFQDAAFSTSDLTELAEEMAPYADLIIGGTAPFQRVSGDGIATNADVRTVSFSGIVLEEGLNSDVIELSETSSVVVHRNEYFEAGVAPLDQVRDVIEEQLRVSKATGILTDRAMRLAEEMGQGASPEEVSRREELEWRVNIEERRGDGGVVGNQIFDLSLAQGLPQSGYLIQPQGGYIVYRLDEAKAGSLGIFAETERRQLRTQLSDQVSGAEFNAYTATLRNTADIDVLIDAGIEI